MLVVPVVGSSSQSVPLTVLVEVDVDVVVVVEGAATDEESAPLSGQVIVVGEMMRLVAVL